LPYHLKILCKGKTVRKKEREITGRKEIESIIQNAHVCRVGFTADDQPYIVPMFFGYEDNCLYFHCATEGKKLDIIRRNNKVCFEVDIDDHTIKPPGRPCGWSGKYRCVMGTGEAFILERFEEKVKGLNIVTGHYGGNWYDFSEQELINVGIIKIEISEMTGKKAGY
jgi:uncharacterized protein